MKRRMIAVLSVLVLVIGMAVPAYAAGKVPHGTEKEWIHEDAVDNTPPTDYVVNRATQADAKEGKYNAFFLKEQLQTVHIEINNINLNYLLQNAKDEPYVMTQSVTIGGTRLGYCGLRTKGNFTLAHAYDDNPGSDRFSFTINFGKYITKDAYGEKQNFYGCEKISFNNFFFDKSMMKEYCAMRLMAEMGLPTPQHGLAKLYINGQYYGVYFMVEAMDETILEQHWKVDGKDISPYLCKPTGTRLDYESLSNDPAPLYEWDEEKLADVQDMMPTVMDWVKKLNQLSDGTDFEGNPIDVNSQQYLDLLGQILDLEEVVKYFATASWLCQMDNMFTNLQNYGLYISQQGKATLLPWDYDLAFGCYYPSTAETTANYPIEVMFQLDRALFGNADTASQRVYPQYPLFHVIWQNDALMEQFRGYMADCSRIAALGGTVESTGKSYDPAYFDSLIDAIEDELVAAATEKLASNVYYMNHIRQPQDVRQALPNLSAIIAQRSLGVWLQVNHTEASVSAAGCDLATLGNAMTGEFTNNGALATIDPGTGIYAIAEYEGGRRAFAPALHTQLLTADSKDYPDIAAQLEMGNKDTLLIYEINSTTKAKSSYTLTIPLAAEHMKPDTAYQFFTYRNGTLTPLEMTQDGNLFTAQLNALGTVVMLVQPPQDFAIWIIAGVVGALVLAGGIALVLVKKRRNI